MQEYRIDKTTFDEIVKGAKDRLGILRKSYRACTLLSQPALDRGIILGEAKAIVKIKRLIIKKGEDHDKG